jgi:hypothetical protein
VAARALNGRYATRCLLGEAPSSTCQCHLPPCLNADVLLPRLLFLVSPTCKVCVTGAVSAPQTVLALTRADDFRLYILWPPGITT